MPSIVCVSQRGSCDQSSVAPSSYITKHGCARGDAEIEVDLRAGRANADAFIVPDHIIYKKYYSDIIYII